MSIRSFVAFSSLLLLAWLGIAFLHTPTLRGGVDPVTAEAGEVLPADAQEVEDLTVSVSPLEVTPD